MAKKPKHDRREAEEATEFLRQTIRADPRVGVLTGTGLGDVTASVTVDATIDFEKIPHFPVSTVDSHPGRLLSGVLSGESVLVLQGRVHLYEGYTPQPLVLIV